MFTYPLRSGYVNLKDEAEQHVFRDTGINGYGWQASSSPTTATSANFLKISTKVEPSRGPSNRRYGFSLRCLSTTAVGTYRKQQNYTLITAMLANFFRFVLG